MKTGKVKWFNAEKGYGFISGDDGVDAFVHYSNIVSNGFRTLSEGQAVCYDVEETGKGVKAVNVQIIS